MSRAALQASNTSIQNVAANGLINIGNVRLRFGRDVGIANGSAVIKTCGYYNIESLVTVQPTAEGIVTVKLQHNGIDIPGATATTNVATAGQSVTLSLNSMIRVVCNNGCPCESIPDTVSLILVEGAGDVTSVLMSLVKL